MILILSFYIMCLKTNLLKITSIVVFLVCIVNLYNANQKNIALLYSIACSSCSTNMQFFPWDSVKITQRESIVYRFSEYMCDECIFQDLVELHNVQEKMGKERIWVLCDFQDNRLNNSLFKNRLHDFNYLNIPSDSLPFPLDKNSNEKRYFAITNSEGNIKEIFYPQKNRQELTAFILKYWMEKLL